MTKTHESFAYRLFHAIRKNKKALISERPSFDDRSASGFAQREALLRVVQEMFQFEKFARGNQQALAGVTDSKHFTQSYKRPGLRVYNSHLNFVNQASSMANRIVLLMLNCQSLLLGPTWQQFLSLEGMPDSGVRKVILEHIRYHRLSSLVNGAGDRAGQDFSVSFAETFHLKMEFKTGSAVKNVEQFFAMPSLEGKSIEEQIVGINRYWTDIKMFAREASKEPRNWPTLSDSRDVDVQRVKYMLDQFYRGLQPSQKALIQKHPEEVSRFFNSMK